MTGVQFCEAPHGSPDYARTVELRDRILRAPLGLAFSEAELAAERGDIHLMALDVPGGGELIGCLVLTAREPGLVRMRQVAVREDWQGRGLGRALVDFCEAVARERGFARIECHARKNVGPFYEKLGYAVTGAEFEEVGIPHLHMEKALR